MTRVRYITGEVDLKKYKADAAYNQFSGRPDWMRIGKELSMGFPGKDVGVFLTGPAAIKQQLVAMCDRYNPPPPPLGTARPKGPPPDRARFKFHQETF